MTRVAPALGGFFEIALLTATASVLNPGAASAARVKNDLIGDALIR